VVRNLEYNSPSKYFIGKKNIPTSLISCRKSPFFIGNKNDNFFYLEFSGIFFPLKNVSAWNQSITLSSIYSYSTTRVGPLKTPYSSRFLKWHSHSKERRKGVDILKDKVKHFLQKNIDLLEKSL
jgi:hypothetical protein